jgi:putative membrane protein
MSRNSKVLLSVLADAFVVFVVLPIFAGSGLFGSGSMMGPGGMMSQGDMMGQGGMMDGGWGVLGILWLLVQLLFLGGLVAVIVWAVVRISANRQGGGADARAGGNTAEEVLRQRFSRGEIDQEEYEERRRILREESPAAHR